MAVSLVKSLSMLALYLMSIAHAIVLPEITTQLAARVEIATAQAVTRPSTWSPNDLLRKRQLPNYVCGYSGTFSVTCINELEYCEGRVLSNGAAYAVCVTDLDVPPLALATTAYAYPGYAIDPCPASALCCGEYEPYVEVDLYVESGYTVTGFVCAAEATTAFLFPNPNVLDPSVYSRFLATHDGDSATTPVAIAAQSASSSSSHHISHTTATTQQARPRSTSSHPSQSNTSQPSPTSTDSSTSRSSSAGQSESNRIALGVGIGIGLPATIAALVMCLRKTR